MRLPIGPFLRDEWRVLTFRRPGSELRTHRSAYLILGLFMTWLVGIGRYWDHPDARWWQYLGLGSVLYVFLLAAFIWLAVWPLGPKNWSYSNVLLFLTMTSAPAFLYAIPVEMFLEPIPARDANTWALTLVALWRVALYAVFLRRVGGLDRATTTVGTFFPIFIILLIINVFNLQKTLLSIMRGDRDGIVDPHDGELATIGGLFVWAMIFLPGFFIVYLFLMIKNLMKRKGTVHHYHVEPRDYQGVQGDPPPG